MESQFKVAFILLWFPINILGMSSTNNDTDISAVIRIINDVKNVNTIQKTTTTIQPKSWKPLQTCCEVLIPKCESVFDPFLRFTCSYVKEQRCGEICIEKKPKDSNTPKGVLAQPGLEENKISGQNATISTTKTKITKIIQPQLKSFPSSYFYQNGFQNTNCMWPYYYFNCPIQQQYNYAQPQYNYRQQQYSFGQSQYNYAQAQYNYGQQPCFSQAYWPYNNCNNQVSNFNSHCDYCYSQSTMTSCPLVCINEGMKYHNQLPCNDFYSCWFYYGSYGSNTEVMQPNKNQQVNFDKKVPPVLAAPISYLKKAKMQQVQKKA